MAQLTEPFEKAAAPNVQLYSLTKGQAAIRDIARAMRDTTGNLPPLPGIFPDQVAPVVRTARDGVRELTTMRWGFPPVAKPGARPITNVRNLAVRLLARLAEAGVPLRRPGDELLRVRRALRQAADVVRARRGPAALRLPRHLAPVDRHPRDQGGAGGGRAPAVCVLTTDANAVVAPVHPKAMPVLLRTAEEIDRWLTAPVEEALELQRPLPDDALQVVATGPRQDGPRRRWPDRIAAEESRGRRSLAVEMGRQSSAAVAARAPAPPRVIARPTAPNK